jgi:hypothetical protein
MEVVKPFVDVAANDDGVFRGFLLVVRRHAGSPIN